MDPKSQSRERVTDTGPSWQEFEAIIARLHRAFHPTAKITRNERLMGRNSLRPRQIDICIREKFGIQEILIIVECKQWRRKIDVKTVEAFVGVKEDVGAHSGIIISASGSTRGARNTATRNHINVYSYRDTKSEQWPNGLKVPVIIEAWILRPTRLALRNQDGSERELTTDTDVNVFDAQTGKSLRVANILADGWRRHADRTEGTFQLETPVGTDPTGPFQHEILMGVNARCERYLREGRLHFAGVIDEEKRKAHAPGYQLIVEGESRPFKQETFSRNYAGVGWLVVCSEVETLPSLKAPKRSLVISGTIEVKLNSPHPVEIELNPLRIIHGRENR